MTERQGVRLSGPEGQALASGVRLGPTFFATEIRGIEPESGALGDGPERQFSLAFQHLRDLVIAAGLGPDQIAQITVFINDASYRPFINTPWLDLFPDDAKRAARKTTHTELPSGDLVQLQAIGLIDGPREPLEIPGLAHRDPLPMGAKLGGLIFSSVLGGDDPQTGQRAAGVEQIRQAFENLRSLVEGAGGGLDDVAQVWVYLGDQAFQPALVRIWLEMFPEEGNRPARKTIAYELGGTTLIQLQAVAVLGGERRVNFEIPGIGHHDPIPLATRNGAFLFSSGVDGRDPATGELRAGTGAQARQALDNVETLLRMAGGGMDHLAHVTAMVGDWGYQEAVRGAWELCFPDRSARPALQLLKLGVAGRDTLVQLHATAVF